MTGWPPHASPRTHAPTGSTWPRLVCRDSPPVHSPQGRVFAFANGAKMKMTSHLFEFSANAHDRRWSRPERLHSAPIARERAEFDVAIGGLHGEAQSNRAGCGERGRPRAVSDRLGVARRGRVRLCAAGSWDPVDESVKLSERRTRDEGRAGGLLCAAGRHQQRCIRTRECATQCRHGHARGLGLRGRRSHDPRPPLGRFIGDVASGAGGPPFFLPVDDGGSSPHSPKAERESQRSQGHGAQGSRS